VLWVIFCGGHAGAKPDFERLREIERKRETEGGTGGRPRSAVITVHGEPTPLFSQLDKDNHIYVNI
jgi:hypothetical protein